MEYLWQVNVAICSGGARITIKTSCLHVLVLDIAKNLLEILSEKKFDHVKQSNNQQVGLMTIKICQVGKIC